MVGRIASVLAGFMWHTPGEDVRAQALKNSDEIVMKPIVSVLIPAHNAANYVEDALDSVLRQTFDDFEVIVVNDGSTDSTPDILDEMNRRDERIRVIHAPQRGIIAALNLGIAVCEGKFIARMDADDICHPDRLRSQVELMESNSEISVCGTLVKMFPRRNLRGGMVRYEKWLNSLISQEQIHRDIFIESPLAHPSTMLRRNELIELGGYREYGWAEDYDLWLRYHIRGKQFAKVNSALVMWRQSEGRLTFTDSRYSVENFLRVKAHYLTNILGTCGRPVVLWGAGKTGRRLIKHLLRDGLEIEAVIDIDESRIGHRLRGRPIVARQYLETRHNAFVISAVSSSTARELIREYLTSIGKVETQDFICAA